MNNSDFESQGSLNDAFELIKRIFDEERNSYERTIKSLQNKISELEKALVKANQENMKYQSKISTLKGRIASLSKTISKLEESDYEIQKNKDFEVAKIIINNDNEFNNIKYRNTSKMNSFRRKTKYISNINRSAIDDFRQNIGNNFFDTYNNKQLNNGEDIKTNYNYKNKKPNKKAISSIIKSTILNVEETEEKKINCNRNNLYKNYSNNGENHSLYLHSNGHNEKIRKNRNSDSLHSNGHNEKIRKNRNSDSYDKKSSANKVKYLSSEKYNKIEQKIKGIKSGLTIYKEKEESKLNDSFSNNSKSINDINTYS